MHTIHDREKVSAGYAWFIWGLGALFYFYEFAVRVAPSVMQPELQAALGVSTTPLSNATAAYYYAYASLQLIIGVLLDRFGPRRILILSSALLTLGCFFAMQAQSLSAFGLGRFLQGAGSAVGFIGVLYLASVWFPKNKMARIAGLTNALGMLGAMSGQGPLAFVVDAFGWQHAFSVCLFVGLGLTVLLGVFTPRSPPHERQERSESLSKGWLPTGLIVVMKNPQTWILSFIASCLYVCLPAFAELFGVDFAMRKMGASRSWASGAVSMIYLGWLVGGPLAGWLSDTLGQRKRLLQGSLVLTGSLFTLLLYAPATLGGPLLYTLLFLAGCASSVEVICFIAVFECNPYAFRGAAMSVTNMWVMVLGGLAQPVVAWLLDTSCALGGRSSATPEDYQWALLFIPALCALGFIASLFLKETFRNPSARVESEGSW